MKGQVLLLSIMLLIVVGLMATGVFHTWESEQRISFSQHIGLNAFYLAQADCGDGVPH